MKYRWTDCPRCHCHLAINYSDSPSGISGSLRRWSADRSTNDGKALRVARAELSEDGGFVTTCVCGQATPVPAKSLTNSTIYDSNCEVLLSMRVAQTRSRVSAAFKF